MSGNEGQDGLQDYLLCVTVIYRDDNSVLSSNIDQRLNCVFVRFCACD